MLSPLETAIQLAVRAHTGQMDEDGMPHIVHCFEVMLNTRKATEIGGRYNEPFVREKLGYTGSVEDLLIAAILHDTVEDSWENPTALERVDLERVEVMFGKNVRDIVDAVTRRGKGESKETYRDFIYRAKAHAGGRIVKVADLNHNLSRSHRIKQAKWREKLEFKYRIALGVLTDPLVFSWEQASWSVTHDGGLAHFFVADPNGKRIEIPEEEFNQIIGKDARRI